MVVSPERDAHYRKMGLSNVKDYVLQWSGQLQLEAREWIAKMEAELAEEERVHRSAELDIARSAKEAALEANEIARASNDLAASANSIALAASASAERSAVAALRYNKIAKAALTVAAIAMLISIVALFKK